MESHWNKALDLSKRHEGTALIVFDELQKVVGWSEIIKALWDQIKDYPVVPLKVLLLGSSALMMQAGLTESLGGRFMLHHFPHWTFSEMRDFCGFSFDEYIYFGGYPGAAKLRGSESDWRSYILDSLIDTTLNKDILQLQRITKPALLRALFFAAVHHPAEIVSYNKLMGLLHDAGNATTLVSYLQLLSSAFLIRGIKMFPGEISQNSTPKLITLNNALVSACAPLSFSQAKSDPRWWGRLVENSVGAHLCNGIHPLLYKICYFRKRERGKDLEVDFVVSDSRTRSALEISTGISHNLRGLEYFCEKHDAVPKLLSQEDLELFLSNPASSLFP